jgi:hypothetical protein
MSTVYYGKWPLLDMQDHITYINREMRKQIKRRGRARIMKKTLGTMAATIVVAILIGTFITATCATAGETARDGRFIAYSNGTVLDTLTKLMWSAKDNGSDINWENAKSYCKNYRGGGHKDWRMPTQDELAGLYDGSKVYMVACGGDVHITEFIRVSCYWAWASETRDSKAAFFNWHDGHRPLGTPLATTSFRALPVRSGK